MAGDSEAVAAARGVLATLSAGRAALLQVATAHLPFDRALALYRLAEDRSGDDAVEQAVERRLRVHDRAMRAARAGELAALALPAPATRVPTLAPPVPPVAAPLAAGKQDEPTGPGEPPAVRAPGRVSEFISADADADVVVAASPPRGADVDPQEPPVPVVDVSDPVVAPAAVWAEPPAPIAAEATSAVSSVHLMAGAAPETDDGAVDIADVLQASSAEGPPEAAAAPPPSAPTAAPDDAGGEDLGEALAPEEEGDLAELGDVLGAPEGTGAAAPLIVEDAPAVDEPAPVAAGPSPGGPSLSDLLSAAPAAEADATVIAAPSGGEDDLQGWAADALGATQAPAAVPTAAARATPLPTLREPRVEGSRVAMIDVRAAARGVAPRVAGPETLEAPEHTGDHDPDDDGGSEGFQVTFERGTAARTRPAPTAPRLTDDEPGERTEPGMMNPQPVAPTVVVDEKALAVLIDTANGHARRGDLSRAIQAFTDALDLRPTLIEAFIGRGRCHLELGDYSSAMSDFARAEDLAPDRPDAHVATGDLYFARKEYKRAIEFYDQAVELDGAHAMARCRRGISHYYRKNYRQAHQDLQRALSLDPEIPNIRKYVQMAQKKLERGD
jgi:Flp pilus assembly protein TadD